MKPKTKVLLISIIIIFILTIFIGTSYSLWQTINTQDDVNMATTKCFNVEITSEKNSITLENAYPITNEKGKKLTPYSFTITNTCDVFASYQVNLESLKSTTLASKFLDVMINNEEIKKLSEYENTDTVNNGSIESHILAKGSLGSGDSVDYTLRLWIDYDTTMEDLDNETKSLKSKIVVISQPSSWSPVSSGYDTLHDAILANEYQTSPEVAIKKIEAKGTPDFAQPAPVATYEIYESQGTDKISILLPTSKILSNPNAVGITEKNILPLVATDYSFDNATGKFTLKNYFHSNLEELNFNNNKYYTCANDQIVINGNGSIGVYSSHSNCSTIYQIISFQKSISQKDNIEANRYIYTVKKKSQNIIESDKSDKGLYKTNDDYGISYYYRGNVNNNYVNFGNFSWQIIRINGDNSIRLLYNGKIEDSKSNTNSKSIGTSSFNKQFTDNAYVGYMFGEISSNSYSNTHKNIDNSNVKTFLDDWYENNILNKALNVFFSNNGFCNDRSIYNGLGFKNNSTVYNAYHRLYELSSPTLKCQNINNDLFTLNDSKIGNKSLKYPIGLITADEAMFSGLIQNTTINRLAYTYSDNIYWTMTPLKYVYNSTEAHIFPIIEGYIHNWGRVSVGYDVRPVINLKADVKITGGIGTINDPFVVKTK